jgi:hypothetical protein
MYLRKIWLVFLLLMATGLAVYAGFALAADYGAPGTDSDPLVTKSYVENYVRDALASAGKTGLQWQIKNLSVNEEFICVAGTNFIVRTGSAVVVDPTGSGIPDLTSGVNVANGKPATRDHLFIVPRSDGRGIRAQSPVIIMYLGDEGK